MSQSLRIAVADDEPDMRDYLQRVLERLGHIVLGPVENGLKLVELCLCQQPPPDLVITDIRMAGLDGDEALRKIRAIHPVPCIVMSAYGDLGQLTFDTGQANWTYLVKPFRKDDLHQAITQLMS
jgi:CheY-like chemotaxis protein